MYNKFLVPVDGSEFGECVFKHVKEIATGCHVPEVVLFRVIEPLGAETVTALAEVGSNLIVKAEEEQRAEAARYMERITAVLRREGLNVTPISIDGRAADAILAYAADKKPDMIIMSTHGRSGASRWLFGSVTDKVVRNSRVPVLTVSPPGCRTGSGG